MKALFSSIKLVSLRKVVTATLFAVLLMITTACASADTQAANPNSTKRVATRETEMLYPGAETPAGRAQKEAEMPIITEKDFQPKPGGLIQREEGVGERIKDRVGTVTESVKDASAFLKDKADEASARPELKPNPAVQ